MPARPQLPRSAQPPCGGERRQAALGLLERRARWGLTWRAKILAGFLLVILSCLVLLGAHPFLAVTCRVPAKVLVVDGWVPTHTLKQAAAEYMNGKYQLVLVVRGIYDLEDKYESGRYSGDYVANLLVRHGVPKESVQLLFFTGVQKDRTYTSALVVKQWLAEHDYPKDSLVVATVAAHARRSRLLYEKAFQGASLIGIVALANNTYDSGHWWRSSEGTREVLGEGIAYLYARCLFRLPPDHAAVPLLNFPAEP